jgi:hypothetical protein
VWPNSTAHDATTTWCIHHLSLTRLSQKQRVACKIDIPPGLLTRIGPQMARCFMDPLTHKYLQAWEPVGKGSYTSSTGSPILNILERPAKCLKQFTC